MNIKSRQCGSIVLDHRIGEESAYASLFAGTCNDLFPVAIKITKSQSLEREAEMLRICGPLHITPKIYDYFIQEMYHVIIMDIMDMTLSRFLTLYDADDPTSPDLYKLAYKIVRKLHKLHSMGYVHGD